jgi:predicted Zn-dependent protease with MMP-like domain
MTGGTARGRERFEELVAEAIDGLPDDILRMLDNVEIVAADTPTAEQLDEAGDLEAGEMLLGLYAAERGARDGDPRTGPSLRHFRPAVAGVGLGVRED